MTARTGGLISLVAVDGRAAGPDFYGLTDLASPHIVLSGYHFDIVLSDGMFMVSHSCSWRLLFYVVLSSLSPGKGSFTDILRRSFQTLDFIDDTTIFDPVSCLWGGPGWSVGCWRACGKPRLRDFLKFWPVFRMYLWYMVSPRWCGPGHLWCYERCRTCFGVGDLEGPLLVAIGLENGLDMSDFSIFLLPFSDHAFSSVNECSYYIPLVLEMMVRVKVQELVCMCGFSVYWEIQGAIIIEGGIWVHERQLAFRFRFGGELCVLINVIEGVPWTRWWSTHGSSRKCHQHISAIPMCVCGGGGGGGEPMAAPCFCL